MDFDDTLRLSYAKTAQAPLKILTEKKLFIGMQSLAQDLSSQADHFIILTSSPHALRGRIGSILDENEISYTQLITRGLLSNEDQYTYKLTKLVELADLDDEFVLIGDNVFEDLHVFRAFQTLQVSKDVSVYIHKIEADSIPKGVESYISSFELAKKLNKKGFLSEDALIAIEGEVLFTDLMQQVVPNYAHCPLAPWGLFKDNLIDKSSREIMKKILNHCWMNTLGVPYDESSEELF